MLFPLLAPAAAARWCFVLSAGFVLIFTSCDRQPSTTPLAPDPAHFARAPKVDPLSFSALDAGGWHACALTALGEGYCWGSNHAGQGGNGTTSFGSYKPVAVAGRLTFSAISAGGSHTCGIASGIVSGTAQAYCWGWNDYRQLGTEQHGDLSTPDTVIGGFGFGTISAGGYHTCALTSPLPGEAFCWGYVGGSITTTPSVPTPVARGLVFNSISAGGSHACALDPGGQAYCWGSNRYGQLGNGTYSGSLVPIPVSGARTYSAISAGADMTCAIAAGVEAGKAYCWGRNNEGQIGNGTRSYSGINEPVAVAGGLTFNSISSGGSHACAIESSTGRAYCWGWNGTGQLGDDTTISSNEPVAVAGKLTFTAISAGAGYTCALASSTGRAYCWGDNLYGQLGIGNPDRWSSTKPVAVVAP